MLCLLLFSDDLLVTNPKRIKTAIEKKSCNALLLKVNRIYAFILFLLINSQYYYFDGVKKLDLLLNPSKLPSSPTALDGLWWFLTAPERLRITSLPTSLLDSEPVRSRPELLAALRDLPSTTNCWELRRSCPTHTSGTDLKGTDTPRHPIMHISFFEKFPSIISIQSNSPPPIVSFLSDVPPLHLTFPRSLLISFICRLLYITSDGTR